ncbi:uncharacterized protein LOC125101621 [Lutra lutra]|uniref:uncharacterized protein LOC125101621 n=1 Tax=Lutra lutra TaxID=9657 RepID=UPI001FD06EBA|nr:uncharacterized protein LOC125101621 [Lutra lutra]
MGIPAPTVHARQPQLAGVDQLWPGKSSKFLYHPMGNSYPKKAGSQSRGGPPSLAPRLLGLALGSGKRWGCAAAGSRSWKAALCPVTCGFRIVSCGRAVLGSPGRHSACSARGSSQHPGVHAAARCFQQLLDDGAEATGLWLTVKGEREPLVFGAREGRCVPGERTLARFLQPLQPSRPSSLLVTLALPALDLGKMVTVVTKLVYCFHFRLACGRFPHCFVFTKIQRLRLAND